MLVTLWAVVNLINTFSWFIYLIFVNDGNAKTGDVMYGATKGSDSLAEESRGDKFKDKVIMLTEIINLPILST